MKIEKSQKDVGSLLCLLNLSLGREGVLVEQRWNEDRLGEDGFIPGGKRDGREGSFDCLVREIREEMSIVIDRRQIIQRILVNAKGVKASVFFAIATPDQLVHYRCHEARELGFVSFEEFENIANRSDIEGLVVTCQVLQRIESIINPSQQLILPQGMTDTELKHFSSQELTAEERSAPFDRLRAQVFAAYKFASSQGLGR